MGKFTIGAASDIGRSRAENQDSYLVRTAVLPGHSLCLCAVCDGMGGLWGGKEASQTAVTALNDCFDDLLFRIQSGAIPGELDMESIDDEAAALFRDVNDELVRRGEENLQPMGTTATALLIADNKYRIYHVGDSRAYHYGRLVYYKNRDDQKNQKIRRITDDDSLAAEKVRRGEMTEAEALISPDGSLLLQCLGGEREGPDVHMYSGEAIGGDGFFLCSDGVYHHITPGEIADMLGACKGKDGQGVTLMIEDMIGTAMTRGERDNLTGAVVMIENT